jgi:peptide-methionine (S)-S-oxide reductase
MGSSMRAIHIALFLVLPLALWSAGGPGAEEKAPSGAYAKATFAGGCFWCMEHPFDVLPGVVSTTSGYAGGAVKNPSYEDVSSGRTGHRESVEILYDPKQVGYEELLRVFWRNVDPLDPTGQFCDHGSQYRSGIFFHDEEQKRLAEESKKALEKSGRFQRPVVTDILPASEFWRAEDYHQDYYRKNPLRYRYYRYGCGRDARLKEIWGEEAGGERHDAPGPASK